MPTVSGAAEVRGRGAPGAAGARDESQGRITPRAGVLIYPEPEDVEVEIDRTNCGSTCSVVRPGGRA